MSVFLLDVNVLVALVDPAHVRHEVSHVWFGAEAYTNWATCPLTQNGVVRILSNASYPNALKTPTAALKFLQSMCASPGHQFWHDDVSFLDKNRIDAARLLSSDQVTDSYLLMLAVAHGGQLATFDRRLSADAVHGGKAGLTIIG